jgi:hypothetical protein
MTEIWIKPNRRALLFGLGIPLLLLCVGGLTIAVAYNSGFRTLLMVVGVALLALAGLSLITVWQLLLQPRVGYQHGKIQIYLEGTQPVEIPVEIVECFFRGQAEGMLRDANGRDAEVSTVIIRLAEAAKEWHHRDVKPDLGMWCEGYITIRGTWCEPITPELMKRLNQRLIEEHRQHKQKQHKQQSVELNR